MDHRSGSKDSSSNTEHSTLSTKHSRRTTPGTLYVVATPLGNLEDVTLRALRVLADVDLIAAEDTRHSRRLLAHFGIATPLTSYYDQVERSKAPRLIEELKRKKSVALISDAGTPCIADPGYRLVRAALDAGVRVEAVPGPSAVAAALSVSGLPTDRFAFEGFVPAREHARQRFYAGLAAEARTIVVYEAARRLLASLQALQEAMGERPVVIVRELTKVFEEIVRGAVSAVIAQIAERTQVRPLPGEVTLLIGGAPAHRATVRAEDLRPTIERLRAEGMSLKEVAHVLAEEHGLSRREVYQEGLKERERD